ncbi:hypothetical protein LV82_00243 [Albidovulum inexpectatum]|uniref:Fenitrothion hydrolase n=1 Tax=Albidovulum inexpectatum TaxID=196587 RepID=A0A2S5JM43_9RHOB|nr:hypothetical protein [Albidovulum inexpectatum]PPB82315.1 hypothetical protein LV82_00243 [Albidovulum inexpectatum]
MKLLTLIAAMALAPGPAFAHASERMVIQTLPTGWYMLGAGLAVAITALAIPFLRHLPKVRATCLFERPRLLPPGVTNWLAFGLFWVLVAVGLSGTPDPKENLLPLTVWTVIWVGMTLAVALLGNLWHDIDPWRAPVGLLRAALSRWLPQKGIGLSRLEHWPAVLGYLSFAWFETVSLAPSDPAHLARVAASYYLLVLILAVLEGEDWPPRGEFLNAYFALVSRVAPFWAEPRGDRLRIMAALPGWRIPTLPPLSVSAMAFVTLVLSSVTFDGLSETFLWAGWIGVNPLEYPGRSAVMGVNTAGLVAVWAAASALVLGAIALSLPGGRSRHVAGPLMLSLLPIAAGYHIAHYFVALLTDGQYVLAALNDPFGRGWSLLGLPEHWVSFGFLSTRSGVLAIWSFQFAVILVAHLAAVIVHHSVWRGLHLPQTLTAQLPMTALMVAYTILGLWLLSAQTIG